MEIYLFWYAFWSSSILAFASVYVVIFHHLIFY